jgi:hypothetical protein
MRKKSRMTRKAPAPRPRILIASGLQLNDFPSGKGKMFLNAGKMALEMILNDEI